MLSNQPILVTGIGTDVGKTMVCRAICTQLNRPYFKPIQCGLDQTDSDVLRDTNIQVFSEAFSLKAPLSPHHAAEIEQVKVLPEHIVLPEVDNLIIEGAGGLMVPFNYKGYTYADFAKDKQLKLVLVTRHYLGSINHTLLSIEVMKQRNLLIEGIIISGDAYPEAEKLYMNAGVKILGRLPEVEKGSVGKIIWNE